MSDIPTETDSMGIADESPSPQDDIVVGSPVAIQTRVELEGLVGCLINILALRSDLSGHM